MLNPSSLKNRFLFSALLAGLSLLAGCMSLPKPSDNNLDEAKKLIATAKIQAKQNQTDQAIASLNEAKNKITDGDKLKNGQGAYYLNEVWLTAYEGHLEFERNNLPSAAGKWKESFDIEYNGTAAQHSVDAKNA